MSCFHEVHLEVKLFWSLGSMKDKSYLTLTHFEHRLCKNGLKTKYQEGILYILCIMFLSKLAHCIHVVLNMLPFKHCECKIIKHTLMRVGYLIRSRRLCVSAAKVSLSETGGLDVLSLNWGTSWNQLKSFHDCAFF